MSFLQEAMRTSARNKKSCAEKKEIKQYLDSLQQATKDIKWHVDHGAGDSSAKVEQLSLAKEELKNCYARLESILAELYSIKWIVKNKPDLIPPTDTTPLISSEKKKENFKYLEYLERQHQYYQAEQEKLDLRIRTSHTEWNQRLTEFRKDLLNLEQQNKTLRKMNDWHTGRMTELDMLDFHAEFIKPVSELFTTHLLAK